MSATDKKPRELTGRHVLIMLLAFFGIMLGVNAFFTYVAIKTFSGEDVPRSYRQGLEYNQVLTEREAQKLLGWKVSANTADERILVQIFDSGDAPLRNLTISGKLRHPATLSNDRQLTFREIKPGLYQADIKGLRGRWDLIATAQNQAEVFRFEHELWLS